MDVNGTRFHLLVGKDDWANCIDTCRQMTLRQIWEAQPENPDTPPLPSAVCDVPSGAAWDAERFELTLQPSLFQVAAVAPTVTPPDLSMRRGADRDRFGNWYWISETGQEVLVNTVDTGQSSHFWSASDGVIRQRPTSVGRFEDFPTAGVSPAELPLCGLAITEDQYLVVGVLQPKGLLIFDLYEERFPRQQLWPPAVDFTPFDMAARPGGGVWILDREHARYWALDRYFNVLTQEQQEVVVTPERLDLFQPADGSSQRRTSTQTFPEGIALAFASPLEVRDAIAIEALPDSTVLILDRNPDESFSLVYRYRFSEQLGMPVSTEDMRTLVPQEQQAGFRLSAYDFAFVPEHVDPDAPGTIVPDRLYIVSAEGNQGYAFSISQQNDQFALQPLPAYFPMRLFGGKGLVAAGYQPYYDVTDRWIPLIEQRRPRYLTEVTLATPLVVPEDTFDGQNGTPDSVVSSNGNGLLEQEPRHAFDGHVPDCVWHRLMLDACIPPETQVQVWSRAANDEGELAMAAWLQEPHLYLRSDGSELPFASRTAGQGNGTWELLFQAARGRFLQLKVKLTGNGRSTPHLRALRIYYPRFSYLEHYLPAVYREDSDSASFLDRFLANIEGFYTTIEDKIAAVQMLFDVRSVPEEYLAWLANWFGVALDPNWSEHKRRIFIKHAMDFFRYRGTLCGLQMALELALDDAPNGPDEATFAACLPGNSPPKQPANGIRIIEHFNIRNTPDLMPPGPGAMTPRSGQRVTGGPWLPSQGGAVLLQRYKDWLKQNGLDDTQVVSFPLAPPEDPGLNALWQQFAQDVLSFIPSATQDDQQVWQNFLARRYQRIDALDNAYQADFTAFEEVPVPQSVPADGPPLTDWYQFEKTVLATRRTAHRFTALLPLPSGGNIVAQQHQLNVATRIINLEKPTHTTFDVRFYVTGFRIGVSHLGTDTLLDQGSRMPQALTPLILGQGYLQENYLASVLPQQQNVVNRITWKT